MEIKNFITKQLTLSNSIMVGETPVVGQSATINSENPNDINFSSWINDQELYKQNRAAIREKKGEFEDEAYKIQDEMIAEKEAKENQHTILE